jgi:hypothetical protein
MLRMLPGYDEDNPSFAQPQRPRRAPDPIPESSERLPVLPESRSESTPIDADRPRGEADRGDP